MATKYVVNRDKIHARALAPDKHIAGDVQSIKQNMTLTASRWNSSSDYYMTKCNHVGNTLYRNDRNNRLKAVEE